MSIGPQRLLSIFPQIRLKIGKYGYWYRQGPYTSSSSAVSGPLLIGIVLASLTFKPISKHFFSFSLQPDQGDIKNIVILNTILFITFHI